VPVPGLSHWDKLRKPLGQAQPVSVGQADWDKLCLSQWDKLCLSQLGLGKVKRDLSLSQRDLSLSHGTSHIFTLEAFPCPVTSSIPTMKLVPVPLVPTCPTKWVYKAVESCTTKTFRTKNFWTNRPEIHLSVSTTSGDPWYQYLKSVQKFNKQVRCGMSLSIIFINFCLFVLLYI